ncbi:MAG: ankyrin repeat domain-containing protein, partial [candidate division WOR-3 bacterium]
MDLAKTLTNLIKQNDFDTFKKIVEEYDLSVQTYIRIQNDDVGHFLERFGTFLIENDAPFEFYKFVYDRSNKRYDKKVTEDLLPSALKGKLDYIKFFYQEGENLKVYDRKGNSILHYSVMSGNEELVKFILELKIVDVNEKSDEGKTPLDIAIEKGFENIANLIKSYGGINGVKENIIGKRAYEEEEVIDVDYYYYDDNEYEVEITGEKCVKEENEIWSTLLELAEKSEYDRKMLNEFERLLNEHIDYLIEENYSLSHLSYPWTIDIILSLLKERNYTDFAEIYEIIYFATNKLIDMERSYKEIIPILKIHKEFLISLRNEKGETFLH